MPRSSLSSAPFRISIAQTLDDARALEGPWRALRDTHGMATPNAEPRHYAATVEALGSACRPDVTLFYDDTGPRAIIIARRSTRPSGCRLGYLTLPWPRLRCLDIVYGGLITDGTKASQQAVCDHLGDLLRLGEIDHVMVNHLPLADALFAPLAARPGLTSAGPGGEPSRHWRFTFAPGRFANTLARFSRKHRYNLRRADRLLVEHFGGSVTLDRITRAEEVDAFADAAACITASGYQGAIGAGFGHASVQRRILTGAARDGRLRSYLLHGAGVPIAFQAGVVSENTYHLQSTAFLPQFSGLSPGQVLLVRVLRDLCEAGFHEVDYGFGDAPYKRVYGTDSREEATIYLFAQTQNGTCARLLHRLTGAATRCASRMGLAEFIKRRWRSRLVPG
ncbi:MAG: GNAT family N-acetyltransferase [Planctomycetota bacterium]|jgi:hypothetical protein